MNNYNYRLLPILAALSVTFGCAQDEETAADRARALHEEILTIDTHDDIPFDFATESVDPLDANRQVNLNKMREGGLDVAFFIVFVGQTARTQENYAKASADAMIKFDAIHRMTDEMYPEQIELAYAADDVRRIQESGKLVAVIGIENGYVIEQNLSLLEKYHELGARYITLAHGGHNDIADSATPNTELGDDVSEHDGISDFGAEVIQEMNRLGIMVDVSHVSKQAALEAMALSRAPVIASHSSTLALADHPRNMDDETMLALKEKGGVIQTVALGAFVKTQPPEQIQARDALWTDMGIQNGREIRGLSGERLTEYERRMGEINARWPAANIQDFVDHIDYAVNLIGIDHVGISSDFDGGGGIVGWSDASETLNVTLELLRRGYNQDQIKKLWGENLLRVWKEVERVANDLN